LLAIWHQRLIARIIDSGTIGVLQHHSAGRCQGNPLEGFNAYRPGRFSAVPCLRLKTKNLLQALGTPLVRSAIRRVKGCFFLPWPSNASQETQAGCRGWPHWRPVESPSDACYNIGRPGRADVVPPETVGADLPGRYGLDLALPPIPSIGWSSGKKNPVKPRPVAATNVPPAVSPVSRK
jgi:hypothetical protein